jgi:dienelactone hydrolase
VKASNRAVVAITALLVLALAGCGASGRPEDPLTRDAKRFFSDDGSPLDVQVKPLGEAKGFTVSSVSYLGARGERVPAVLAVPSGNDPHPCVVFLHGLGGSKNDAQGIAEPMRQLGIGVLAFDAPLQGDRANGTLEQTVQDPNRLANLIKQNVVDARRALDVLSERPECDPGRLGVVGLSFGGLSALLTAAVDKRVRSTVTLSVEGVENVQLLGHGLLTKRQAADPHAVEAALRAFKPLSATRWVNRISPRALLLVNGRQDQLNPLKFLRPLQNAAGKGSEIYLYDGGHNPLEGPSVAGVLERIRQFEAASLLTADKGAG